MRRNGVIDITAAGSSVISVNMMTICIGTLSEAPFVPVEIPRREKGSPAAAMAGRAMARPLMIRSSLTARPPPWGARSFPPAHSRRARAPAAVRFRPRAPGARYVAAPAAGVPDTPSAARRVCGPAPCRQIPAGAITTRWHRGAAGLPPPPPFVGSLPFESSRPTGISPSGPSEVVPEVGDAHAERVFDHHDLTGAAEHTADVDIDILARAS